MNLVEKMERENRLKTNLAEWMILHGTVISDSSKTNAYATIEIIEVEWQGFIMLMGPPAGLQGNKTGRQRKGAGKPAFCLCLSYQPRNVHKY